MTSIVFVSMKKFCTFFIYILILENIDLLDQTTIQWNDLKFDLPGKWNILSKNNKELFATFPGTLKQITVMRFTEKNNINLVQLIEDKTGINIEKESIYSERIQTINGIDIIYASHAHYCSVSDETFYYYFVSIPFE